MKLCLDTKYINKIRLSIHKPCFIINNPILYFKLYTIIFKYRFFKCYVAQRILMINFNIE